MADYAEWFEGTTGVAAPDCGGGDADVDEPEEEEEHAWRISEYEVVVCLVDCNTAMFCRTPSESTLPVKSASLRANSAQSSAVSAQRSEDGSVSNAGDEASNSTKLPDTRNAPSFFSMTLQSIRTLLTEKLVSANRDMVAVVLYNTRACANAACLAGVYVFLDASRIGMRCVQQVEGLAAAGVHGSNAYADFRATIGHSFEERAMMEHGSHASRDGCGVDLDEGKSSAIALCNALWVAQDILWRASDPTATQYKRLFVFTNESDPTQGRAAEWALCNQRVRTLAKTGATLEVFGFRDSAPPQGDSPAAEATFDTTQFWSRLLQEMQKPSPLLPDAVAASYAEARLSNAAMGAVHIHADVETLETLLRTVARRAHPQRPFRRCLLRLGRVLQGRGDGDKRSSFCSLSSAAAAAAPCMAVSLYTPLVRAAPPPHVWLDRYTLQVTHRAVHLFKRESATEEEGHGNNSANGDGTSAAGIAKERVKETEIRAEDVCYYAKVGDERVYFTKEERTKMAEVAIDDAEPGFTVLLFKDVKDVLKRAHIVCRSSFLHVCLDKGGPQSHRLFVLLVRRLRAKAKAAIAQYRSTSTATPRLVALVPSPDWSAEPAKRNQLPVEGLGLYVVPLPFAEDLRPLPQLRSCTLVRRGNTPCLADNTVDPAHRLLAEKIVTALTVSYDIGTVANPALQRQCDVLQRLARRLYPLHDHTTELAGHTSSTVNEEDEEGSNAVHAAEAEPQLMDSTLPDYEGMKRYAKLFATFKNEVLGSHYDPTAYCSQSSSALGAVRRPRSCGDGGAKENDELSAASAIADAVHNAAACHALDSLTVALLKAYLATEGVNVGEARCKADLITAVSAHLASRQPLK